MNTRGLDLFVRTMSVSRVRKKGTPPWQYHPRSDHHSKVACWAILFDLLQASPLLRAHATAGTIAFGINHVMANFVNGKKKALDLVVCRPAVGQGKKAPSSKAFRSLVADYAIELSADDKARLEELPDLPVRPVGSVLIALEAKAAMTEFAKARPRLYSELEDSHTTVHGDTQSAIAVGFAVINAATTFVSPTANPCVQWGAPLKETKHQQPKQLSKTIEAIEQLPRRADANNPGFDALCVVAVECTNKDTDPVRIWTAPPAPQPGDVLHYDSMISRVAGWYSSRFPQG